MIIREMRTSDITACTVITRLNWGQQVALRTRAELSHLLKHKLALYYVAQHGDGTVLGFAGMMPSHIMCNVWDFIWINIHPDFHYNGIGRELTEYRINQVISHKGAAIHLMTQKPEYFKKLGFHLAHCYEGDWSLMINQLQELKL